MREHEVPTHVQAEDRVLLGLTFPQVVAVVAVCALSYGAYRYAPVGPSEMRMAIAVVFGLVGIAMVVGRIGGRPLPLVAADLLKYRLGARVYSGQVAQLVRSEAPAPPQPVKRGPGPLRLMVRRVRRGVRNLRSKKKNRRRDRRDGRMPFRPHGWFGKRRKDAGHRRNHGKRVETLESRRSGPRRGWLAAVAVVLVAMAAAFSPGVLAQSPDDERWRDEVGFQLNEPVEGRRMFVEGLTVSGQRAAVTFRAATDLDIRVRAFGGPTGTRLRFWSSATLAEGERVDYSLPLYGPVPSFTVSWEDGLGQAGALTIEHDRIPYPLPEVEGELCDLKVTSLGWRPGTVEGVVEAECVTAIEHPVELQTVAGHESVTETTLLDAGVTTVTGTVNATVGAASASVAFVPDGETHFRLTVPTGEAVHAVSLDASLEASLRIPVPPLTVLTHHPERVEQVTKTLQIHRPGASDYDSQTVTVTNEDGTTESATATAYAHVPSTTITQEVTVDVLHKEHVKAETEEREPVTRTREERLALVQSGVGADEPYAVLALPEPEPEDPPAEQEPADGPREWFERLGWEWLW